ncbi:MAG: response regulator [Bryobacteraceae bacterium]|nr:response regulator [Bryobacteraceae bacterium]
MEDHDADVFLIREALSAAMNAHFVVLRNGAEAAGLLRSAGGSPSCPDLVILDLNLPGLAGGEVLRLLRSGAVCHEVPVIVVTSSDLQEDRALVLGLGANAYFRKPSDFDSFMKLGAVARGLLEKDSGASGSRS